MTDPAFIGAPTEAPDVYPRHITVRPGPSGLYAMCDHCLSGVGIPYRTPVGAAIAALQRAALDHAACRPRGGR